MADREVFISLPLSEEEAALFEGNGALIIPTSEVEAAQFRDLFNWIHGCLSEASQSNSDLLPFVKQMDWMRAYLDRAFCVEAEETRTLQ